MSKEEGNGGMRRGERGKGLPAKFATLLYTDISLDIPRAYCNLVFLRKKFDKFQG